MSCCVFSLAVFTVGVNAGEVFPRGSASRVLQNSGGDGMYSGGGDGGFSGGGDGLYSGGGDGLYSGGGDGLYSGGGDGLYSGGGDGMYSGGDSGGYSGGYGGGGGYQVCCDGVLCEEDENCFGKFVIDGARRLDEAPSDKSHEAGCQRRLADVEREEAERRRLSHYGGDYTQQGEWVYECALDPCKACAEDEYCSWDYQKQENVCVFDPCSACAEDEWCQWKPGAGEGMRRLEAEDAVSAKSHMGGDYTGLYSGDGWYSGGNSGGGFYSGGTGGNYGEPYYSGGQGDWGYVCEYNPCSACSETEWCQWSLDDDGRRLRAEDAVSAKNHMGGDYSKSEGSYKCVEGGYSDGYEWDDDYSETCDLCSDGQQCQWVGYDWCDWENKPGNWACADYSCDSCDWSTERCATTQGDDGSWTSSCVPDPCSESVCQWPEFICDWGSGLDEPQCIADPCGDCGEGSYCDWGDPCDPNSEKKCVEEQCYECWDAQAEYCKWTMTCDGEGGSDGTDSKEGKEGKDAAGEGSGKDSCQWVGTCTPNPCDPATCDFGKGYECNWSWEGEPECVAPDCGDCGENYYCEVSESGAFCQLSPCVDPGEPEWQPPCPDGFTCTFQGWYNGGVVCTDDSGGANEGYPPLSDEPLGVVCGETVAAYSACISSEISENWLGSYSYFSYEGEFIDYDGVEGTPLPDSCDAAAAQYDFEGDCKTTPGAAGDIFRICDEFWWDVVTCEWDFVVNRPPFNLDCIYSCEGALDGSGSSKKSGDDSTMASTGIIIIACVAAVVVAAAAALAVNHFRAKAHPKFHRRTSMPDATLPQRTEAAAAAEAAAAEA